MSFKIPDTPEELFRQGSQQMTNLNKWFPYFFGGLLIAFVVLTSFYTVEQDEVGVVRRFGKYARTTEPGLHWKIPFGIEKLNRVRVTYVYKEEFGFRTLQPGINTRYSTKSYDDESLMLTGDLNVLDVSWIVQFKIKDPVAFLFNIRDPRETVRDLSEAVMRQVIGDSSVSEVLTVRKNEISEEVRAKIQADLDQYDAGISIDKLELQEVLPPEPVQKSFNKVNEAEQIREQDINKAWKEYEKVIVKARGQAEKTIRAAEGYAKERVNHARGDAAKFIQTWEAYKEAKDVTRQRMYLETMGVVLPKAGGKFVFDQKANTVLPLLNLDKMGR